MTGDQTVSLVYALGALILFGSGALAASRHAKAVGAKGPGPFVSLLIWVALIALLAALYFGAQVWGGLFSAVS